MLTPPQKGQVRQLPADGPVQSVGTDVQSFLDVRVVQVEAGRRGVGAGRIQADGQVHSGQTHQLLQSEEQQARS